MGFQDSCNSSVVLFSGISALVYHPSQNIVYISDTGNARIRAFNVTSGCTSTLAGNGVSAIINGPTLLESSFIQVQGLAIHPLTGNMLISDSSSPDIREINFNNNSISTLISGPWSQNIPDIAFTSNGTMYLCDYLNNAIYNVNLDNGTSFALFSGYGGMENGPFSVAKIYMCTNIDTDEFGSIYISDTNNRIRKIGNPNITDTSAAYELFPSSPQLIIKGDYFCDAACGCNIVTLSQNVNGSSPICTLTTCSQTELTCELGGAIYPGIISASVTIPEYCDSSCLTLGVSPLVPVSRILLGMPIQFAD